MLLYLWLHGRGGDAGPKEQAAPVSITSEDHLQGWYMDAILKITTWKKFGQVCEKLANGTPYTYENFTPLRKGLSRGAFPRLGTWFVLCEFMTYDQEKATYRPTNKGLLFFAEICTRIHAHA